MARDHPLGCPNRSTVVLLVQAHEEKKLFWLQLASANPIKYWFALVCLSDLSKRGKSLTSSTERKLDTGQHNDFVITLVSCS